MKWAVPFVFSTIWSLTIRSAISSTEVPLKSEGFQPHTRYECWKEEPPQHLAVKIGDDSIHPGEMEGCWKSRHPLKWPEQQLICLQALTIGSSGGTAAWWCQRHTWRP